MKFNKSILFITFFSLFCTGCNLDKFAFITSIFQKKPATVTNPVNENQQQANLKGQEEPVPVTGQQEVEIQIDSLEEEYQRSIINLDNKNDVTREDFSKDKTAVLTDISDLSNIMETKDYNNWLKFIDPQSIKYYSNPSNLRKAQNKLPNKRLQLKSLSDYFNYVFIPSRQRSQVDEIRYISKDSIKAVHVKQDGSIVVYYYFTKVDGKWLVHLPELE